MLASSFSTRFLLRKNRRSRSLPPLGATCSLPHFRFAQMWPRIFPRGLPGYVPLFPGWPRARTPALAPIRSHFAPRNRAAGHRPHRGRCFAVPVTAPPRRAPNGKTPALAPIRSHFAPRNRAAGHRPHRGRCFGLPRFRFAQARSPGQNPGACSHSVAFRLRRNRAAGRCPRRGQRARYPIFAPLKCGPTLAPRRLLPFGRISLRETARPVIGPTGADVLPSPSRLRRAGSPTAKPRPSSFSIRFFLRKNRRAHPPAFGRRGVDKVRKYHFVRVVLSSAPLTLSPLYAPARPVFRNRPKEKAAAENRCGCEHAIYEL